MAVEFLAEAQEHLPTRLRPLLQEAAEHYAEVARQLGLVSAGLLERGPDADGVLRDEEAAGPLRLAWQAERTAYSVLGRIERALSHTEIHLPAHTAFARAKARPARRAETALPLTQTDAPAARTAVAG